MFIYIIYIYYIVMMIINAAASFPRFILYQADENRSQLLLLLA